MNDRQVTSPSRPTKSLFNRYNVARIGFFLFGIPKNSFGSVDVTNLCNLRCDHCYYFEQDHASQWPLERWKELFEQMKAEGFRCYQCSWIGGEPLLRPEIIELGRPYFKYNTVTTNGSVPLPNWKDVSWYISVDGGRQNHEKMRNSPGLYDTITNNIEQTEGLKITITYCITSSNFMELDASLAEWSSNPKVRNLLFSFYTPIKDAADELWLESEEKDRVIDIIIGKKHQFGDFILNTEQSLKLMKSDRSRSVTDRCPFASKSFAFDASGNPKQPCMMGPKADCNRCGCVVPFYLSSLTDRRLIMREVLAKAARFFRPA